MDEKKLRLPSLFAIWKDPEKRVKWIVVIGMIGIFLLFLSQFAGKKQEEPEQTISPQITSAAYISSLQKELTDIIGKISGAGKTEVMVTLQNNGETLYVREQKTEFDSTHSADSAVTERESRAESYVLVDGKDGREALVRTQMEPVIKGVIIVCEGGEDPVTVSRIMDAVTTALAISSAKVCITKLA
ncbi:MAG: hypothetical protein ACOX6P_03035 [Candidatus Merdivicinus sp.]|jgi:stage III sporulation protein AG